MDSDRRQLRSAATKTCLIPWTHNNFGERSFNAAGPSMWKSLPSHLRQDMNFAHFKCQLKNFYLGVSQPRHIVTAVLCLRNTFTYLLITSSEAGDHHRHATIVATQAKWMM